MIPAASAAVAVQRPLSGKIGSINWINTVDGADRINWSDCGIRPACNGRAPQHLRPQKWSQGQSRNLLRDRANGLGERIVGRLGMVTQARNPHYLLYSEASGATCGASRWKFVLQTIGGEDQFSASDSEPQARSGRLELLAVVRGLEALDQPSRVTLLTRSRYVARGIRRELNHWRSSRWRWERFGQLVPIRDHDLWRRIDRALQIHDVNCVSWRFDSVPDMSISDEFAPATTRLSSPTSEKASPRAALLIVSRNTANSARKTLPWPITRALNTLRDGVLAPFSAILRPAFTRAA